MERIKRLEFLSKLKFTEEEKEDFEKDFDSIVDFVDEITKLMLPQELEQDDAMDLEELRDDEPMESMSQEDVLSNTPKQKDGCYVTPLVVE